MKVQEIRRDLRDLRRLTHSIEAMLTLRDNHERRIKYLTERERTRLWQRQSVPRSCLTVLR